MDRWAGPCCTALVSAFPGRRSSQRLQAVVFVSAFAGLVCFSVAGRRSSQRLHARAGDHAICMHARRASFTRHAEADASLDSDFQSH